MLVQRVRRHCGKGRAGKGFGFVSVRGMLWDCARQPASGMSRGSVGERRDLLTKKKEPAIYDNVVDFERDAEDGWSFSEEEGEHNVENFMLCSFAQRACSSLLQGFLHEEELCMAALTCHFSSVVLYFCLE